MKTYQNIVDHNAIGNDNREGLKTTVQTEISSQATKQLVEGSTNTKINLTETKLARVPNIL